MYISANKVNRKHTIPRQKVECIAEKYSGIYCSALHELFGLGYLSTPFTEDDFDIWSVLYDDFEEDCMNLLSPLSEAMEGGIYAYRFAMLVSKNEEFRNVMKLLIDLDKSKKALNKCDIYLSNAKFNTKDVSYLTLRILTGYCNDDRSPYKLPVEAFLKDSYKIEKVRIGKAFIHYACRYINISEEEYQEHVSTGQPFFLKDVTQEQEEELVTGVLSGYLPLKGVYGERLFNAIVAYYKKYSVELSNSFMSQISFNNMIFGYGGADCVKFLSDVRDRIYALGGDEIYMDEEYIYYEVPSVECQYVRELSIGTYSNLEDNVSLFKGIEGVFSYESPGIRLFIKDYGFINRLEWNCIPELSEKDMFRKYGVRDERKLRMKALWLSSNALVAELALALMYAECGKTKHVMFEKVEYGEEFDNACKEAIQVVEKMQGGSV